MATPTSRHSGQTRAQKRAGIEAEILAVGRSHLASDGAATLSLRAVARELGMVSSAIYRYVESRDELLTRLLVEAYDDLADTVEDRLAAVPPDHHRARLEAIASALRGWAIGDPARYALLYGSPVPGYQAPPDRTIGPGTRVVALTLTELDTAARAGTAWTRPSGGPSEITTALGATFDDVRTEYGVQLSDGQLVRALAWWAGLIGIVSQEVFNAYGAGFTPVAKALFDAQIAILTDQILPRS